jgi:hypothetical protein
MWNFYNHEFLPEGFDLDPNPNTKLPHEAYLLLLKEYQQRPECQKESEKLILRTCTGRKESVSIDDVPESGKGEDQDRDDEVIIKDISVLKKGIDIKTEIKKLISNLLAKLILKKPLSLKLQQNSETEERKKYRRKFPDTMNGEEEPSAEKPMKQSL